MQPQWITNKVFPTFFKWLPVQFDVLIARISRKKNDQTSNRAEEVRLVLTTASVHRDTETYKRRGASGVNPPSRLKYQFKKNKGIMNPT